MRRALALALIFAATSVQATTTFTPIADPEDVIPGPYRFDVKLGPSAGIIDSGGAQFRVGLHFGMGIATGDRHRLLLAFPLGFGLGDNYNTFTFLPGLEADIQLVLGMPFYIYPMIGIGMGILTDACPGRIPRGCDANVALGLRMGAGIRYVLWGRWNFLFEPLNLEFYPAGSSDYTAGFYSVLVGAGVNF